MEGLLCVSGPQRGRYFRIADLLSIGRGSAADVDVPEAAKLHCCVVRLPDGGLVVIDLATDAGTWLNGRAITRQSLSGGDRIRVGSNEFVVSDAEESDEQTVKHGPGFSSNSRETGIDGPRQ